MAYVGPFPLPVKTGGTGDSSLSAYSVLCAGTTSTSAIQVVSGVGTTGQVLTSNGASALPTWESNLVNTSRPAFLAYLPSNDSSVTGNGATYTLGTNVALTKVFDQANNLTTAGVFTAPVSGRYFLSFTAYFTNVTAVMRFVIIKIVTTSNGGQYVDSFVLNTDDKSRTVSGLFNMAASDTATFTVNISGGVGNTASLQSGSNPMLTYISGYLAC